MRPNLIQAAGVTPGMYVFLQSSELNQAPVLVDVQPEGGQLKVSFTSHFNWRPTPISCFPEQAWFVPVTCDGDQLEEFALGLKEGFAVVPPRAAALLAGYRLSIGMTPREKGFDLGCYLRWAYSSVNTVMWERAPAVAPREFATC